jgi:hypothetical protein
MFCPVAQRTIRRHFDTPSKVSGKRISDSRRVRYPWAMAPAINTTKLVATAIATFASTDKFIIFPQLWRPLPMTPVFEFFLF